MDQKKTINGILIQSLATAEFKNNFFHLTTLKTPTKLLILLGIQMAAEEDAPRGRVWRLGQFLLPRALLFPWFVPTGLGISQGTPKATFLSVFS